MPVFIIMLLKQLGVALVSALLSTRVVLQWILLLGKRIVSRTKTKTDDEFFAPVERELKRRLEGEIEAKLKKQEEE